MGTSFGCIPKHDLKCIVFIAAPVPPPEAPYVETEATLAAPATFSEQFILGTVKQRNAVKSPCGNFPVYKCDNISMKNIPSHSLCLFFFLSLLFPQIHL